jgi:protein PhnA
MAGETIIDRDAGQMTPDTSQDFVYDEASGEWLSPADAATTAKAAELTVRDCVGNILTNGDSVSLIKDLKVKGAGQTLKRGTIIRAIHLTGDAQEIDCRTDGIKGLVLRAEFVKKL